MADRHRDFDSKGTIGRHLRRVLKYVIGGVDDETHVWSRSARPRSSRRDGDGAGHDAPRRSVIARHGLGRNDSWAGRRRTCYDDRQRAGRFHWKEIVQPRPFRARPFRRDFSRGAAQQDQACRREARSCNPRPGMAAPSGPDGRKPEGRESVRLADAPRPARRRRSLASARCGRPYRREPCRSLDRRREPGRRHAQPVDGAHARGAEIRQSGTAERTWRRPVSGRSRIRFAEGCRPDRCLPQERPTRGSRLDRRHGYRHRFRRCRSRFSEVDRSNWPRPGKKFRQGEESRPSDKGMTAPSVPLWEDCPMRWILVSVALLLASASELAAQGKGIRFWNLTTATISSFQLSPAGKDTWGPNQTLNDKDKEVDHDERLRITSVEPGRYDAKVGYRDLKQCFVRDIEIKADAVFSIADKDLKDCNK